MDRNSKGQFIKGHPGLKGEMNPLWGKHQSDITKQKLSNAMKIHIKEHPHKDTCNCVICLNKKHLPMPKEMIEKRIQKARETTIKNGSQAKENNPAWKGGLTEKASLERKTKEWIDWRKQIFERDNYTCQSCGKRGCTLHPHHIKKRSEFPELKFNIDNGLTLCNNCHTKIHSLDRLK